MTVPVGLNVNATYVTFFSLVASTFWMKEPAWSALDSSAVPILSSDFLKEENWTMLWLRDFSTKLPMTNVREKYLATIGDMIEHNAQLNRNLRAQYGCQAGLEKLVENSLYPQSDLSDTGALKTACEPTNLFLAQYACAVTHQCSC